MKSIIIFLTLLIPAFTFSQVRIPVTITDYGNRENSWQEDKRNVIKTSPFSFITGRQYFDYERGINRLISIQGTLGTTFQPFVKSRNLGSEYLNQENRRPDCPYFNINGGGCQNYNDFSYRKFTPGFIAGLSVKFYFEQNFMEGFYVGLATRYTQFNNDVQRIESGQTNVIRLNDSWDKEKFRFSDLVATGGYQYLTEHIVLEAVARIGVRGEKNQFQSIYRVNSVWNNGSVETSARSVLLEVGGTIGFRF